MRRTSRASARKNLIIVALAFVAVCAVLGIFAHGSENSSPEFERARVISVIDGDTVFVKSESGKESSVRLIGIDCPESVNPDAEKNTPEGKLASEFTASVLHPGDTVYLVRDVSDTDKYGRWLRYVWLELPQNPRDLEEVRTKMLQGVILAAGHAKAVAYSPDTSYASLFSAIEQSSKEERS